MRRNPRRFLNESDFPFTVEEVLEQINKAKKIAIKKFYVYLKLFENGPIKGEDNATDEQEQLAEISRHISILNDMQAVFMDIDDSTYSIKSALRILKQHWLMDRNSTWSESFTSVGFFYDVPLIKFVKRV